MPGSRFPAKPEADSRIASAHQGDFLAIAEESAGELLGSLRREPDGRIGALRRRAGGRGPAHRRAHPARAHGIDSNPISLQRLREHEGRPVERELQMGVSDDLSARLRAALAVGWWVEQEAMLGGVKRA